MTLPLPQDPITDMATAAAAIAELYSTLIEAGIPSTSVAVMIGQWLAASTSQGDGE